MYLKQILESLPHDVVYLVGVSFLKSIHQSSACNKCDILATLDIAIQIV